MWLIFEQLNRSILEEIQLTRGLDNLEAKKIVYQMIKACAHMHQLGIVHRDIKPENLLLSKNGVLKVCDMGFARYMNNQSPLTEYVSTRWYRAPELLIESAGYGTGIDIWAIGCIFVELITGKPLFTGKNDYEMLKLILTMFNCSEELPLHLKTTFQQNNLFSSLRLPEPSEEDYNFDLTLDA